MKTILKLITLLAVIVGVLAGIAYYEEKHGSRYIEVFSNDDDDCDF